MRVAIFANCTLLVQVLAGTAAETRPPNGVSLESAGAVSAILSGLRAAGVRRAAAGCGSV